MKKYLLIALVLAVLSVSVIFLWPRQSIDLEKAKELATAQLHRFGKDFGFDVSVFQGPKEAKPPINVPYQFEWTYADKEGEVKVIVLVDKTGWTDVASQGNLERLRNIPR